MTDQVKKQSRAVKLISRMHKFIEAGLDWPLRYRVIWIRNHTLSARKLLHIILSREVTLLVGILSFLLGMILLPTGVVSGLVAYPSFWALIFCPFLVTYLSWVLTALRVLLSYRFVQEGRPVRVLTLPNTMIAANLGLLGGLASADLLSLQWFIQLRIGEQLGLIGALLFVTGAYAVIAELIHIFVLSYVIPVDGTRGQQIIQNAGKPLAQTAIARVFARLSKGLDTSKVTIGTQDVLIEEIAAVEAHGNYVKIHANGSEEVERVPFSQVVATLPADIGLQLHRSHWVAFAAIKSFRRAGNEGFVTLQDGAEVKVARSRVKATEEILSQRGLC